MKYFLLILLTSFLNAQDILPDSLGTKTDSLSQRSPKKSLSKTPYYGDLVTFYKNDKGDAVSEYIGNAKIIYEDMQINAYRIIVNHQKNVLTAYPKTDTLKSGKVNFSQIPVFLQEGNEPMYGEKMEYDFTTRRGRVYEGKTEMKPSKYEGEEIKKFGESTILIRDGRFTTCDADTPSYWFHSDKIRMVDREMIYTGPVVMHIYDIPFPIPLPFGIFNLKKGRRSGVFIPSYYYGSQTGRGLKEFGYYWAASNKYEAELSMDYFEKSGFHVDLINRFKNGKATDLQLQTRYSKFDKQTGDEKNDIEINFNVRQDIDPSFRINGNGNYKSSINTNKYRQDINQQVNQTIYSVISFDKKWDNGHTLSGNSNYRENLLTKRANATLPSLRYSAGNFKPFGNENGLSKPWYSNINMSYNSQLTNNWSQETAADSTGDYYVTDQNIQRGLVHNISLNSPSKIFKYITFNPNISYREVWVDRVNQIQTTNSDSLVVKEVNEFGALRTFNMGVSMNTNLYGLFEPNISSLKIVRHKLNPSISFNYRPDFSKKSFGYTQNVDTAKYDLTKYSGNLIRTRKDGSQYIDRFANTPYGSTPSSEQLSANFGLGNTFSGKLIDDKGNESKVDILNFNSSASYNFLADSLNWSTIGSSFRFPFIKFMNFQGNMTHSLYKLDSLGRPKNEFVSFWPQLRNFTLSSSIQIDQSLFGSNEKTNAEDTPIENNDNNLDTEARQNQKALEQLRNSNIPWNTNISLNYNYDPYGPNTKTSFSSNINTTISLTKKWKMSHSMNYDIKDKRINYQNLRITRDLECWNFSFNYTVQPFRSYFLLTISISEDMLNDLKYEKRSRNSIL